MTLRNWHCLVAIAVAGAFACAKTSSPIILRDAGITLDAGTGKDAGGSKPDLAQNGGSDGAMGGCTMIDAWPGLMPQGGYDDTNVVTFAASTDQANPPFNALTVEDYHGNGINYPKMVTYSNADNYSSCDVCTLIQVCDAMSCTDTYFAQAGSVTVTQSDQNVGSGTFTATASDLLLVEWDFNGDAAIPNGKCIQIASASFDVSWTGTSDGGMPGSDGGMPGNDGGVLGCVPLVNEVQTGGAKASDEFVELFNPCNAPIDLTGWKLAYRSAGDNKGGADTLLYAFPAKTQLAAGAYFTVGGSTFTGPHDAIFQAGGLAAAGGAVGLRDANAQRADSMSWAVLTTPNAFTESAPAVNPPANSSLARHPNGADTNDNSKDFVLTNMPSPGAANQ